MSVSREHLTALELAKRSDGELLELAAESADAFEVFYRRHVKGVLSYLAYRVGNREAALDLTSEVFAAALAGTGRFRREKGPGRAWLFGIANNKLLAERKRGAMELQARRKLGVRWFDFSDDALAEVENTIDVSETGFLSGLEDLSSAEREAIKARVIDEREYWEIARSQNSTQAAIRQRVSRGLAKLRARRRRGPR